MHVVLILFLSLFSGYLPEIVRPCQGNGTDITRVSPHRNHKLNSLCMKILNVTLNVIISNFCMELNVPGLMI